jgi:hypothetical protein
MATGVVVPCGVVCARAGAACTTAARHIAIEADRIHFGPIHFVLTILLTLL